MLRRIGDTVREFYNSLFGRTDVKERLLDPDEETVRELRTTLREKQTEEMLARLASLSSNAHTQGGPWGQS